MKTKKPKLTTEQETALVAAIKEAFAFGESFDATSIYLRAAEHAGLANVLEGIIGPKARYKEVSWGREKSGRLKLNLCRPVILAVQHHFETDWIGWWSYKASAA
jgi:hypothetical protein